MCSAKLFYEQSNTILLGYWEDVLFAVHLPYWSTQQSSTQFSDWFCAVTRRKHVSESFFVENKIENQTSSHDNNV